MKNTLVKPFIRKAQKSDFKAFYNLYKKFEREYEEIAYEPFVKKTKKQLKKEYMLEDIKKELIRLGREKDYRDPRMVYYVSDKTKVDGSVDEDMARSLSGQGAVAALEAPLSILEDMFSKQSQF